MTYPGFSVLGAAVLGTLASTNAAPLTNLPPPFSTNVPGQYQLERPWLGRSTTTVSTGHFAKFPDAPQLRKLKTELRFDLFSLSFKPLPFNFGPQMISKTEGKTPNGWRHSNLHSYRAALPSDGAITICATVPALTNLLGEPQTADGAPFFFGWSFFTATSSNTIEVLSVACMSEHPAGTIDSLEVRRGTVKESP